MSLRSVALAVTFSVLVPLGAAASVCSPGVVADGPRNFGNVRPALALDVNPAGNVVEVDLTAREEQVNIEGGTGFKTMWTYNGYFPGPMIEAEVGDTLIVNLCNDLPEETSIHWHGVETPANMDGSRIAQIAVPAGGTFRYEIPLRHAGTFWYHPGTHANHQVEMGLYGALIVRDPDQDEALGLPDYEHVLMFDDLRLRTDLQVEEPFAGDKEDVALAILNGREGTAELVNGRDDRFFTLYRGVPQRARIINAANARFMRISIPGVTFWRIGGDQGLIEEPIEINPSVATRGSDPDQTTGLLLAPGERAEVIFVLWGTGGSTIDWHDTARGRLKVDFLGNGTVDLQQDPTDGARSELPYATLGLTGPVVTDPYDPPSSLVTIDPIDTAGAQTLQLEFGHSSPDWDTGEAVLFAQEEGLPFDDLTLDDVYTVESDGNYILEVKNLSEFVEVLHVHGWSFQHIETQWVDLDSPGDGTKNFVVAAEVLENKDTIPLAARQGSVPGRSYTITRLAIRFSSQGRGIITAGGKTPTANTSGGWMVESQVLERAEKGAQTFFQILSTVFSDDFESNSLSKWSVVIN